MVVVLVFMYVGCLWSEWSCWVKKVSSCRRVKKVLRRRKDIGASS